MKNINEIITVRLRLLELYIRPLAIGLSIMHVVTAGAAEGFVELPRAGFSNSAYMLCNSSGEFGQQNSLAPDPALDTCSVSSKSLESSQMNAPIEGFNMVGMLVRDIPMPPPYAGSDNNVATLTDTIWRNADKTECIYGTHVQLKAAPLADGSSWEVNDVTRGGFAGLPVAVAYYYKPHADEKGVNTEVIFRVGRTFTSVKHGQGDLALPPTQGAVASDKAVTSLQAAAVSENWVNFTTDLNANDPDGSSRPISPMMYIKTTCGADNPVERENAIRLRTTGQNGQRQLELTLPGLVPVGANLDIY